jgi:hypothetical protein
MNHRKQSFRKKGLSNNTRKKHKTSKRSSRGIKRQSKYNKTNKRGGGFFNVGSDMLSDVEVNPGKMNRTFNMSVTVNNVPVQLFYIIPQTLLLKNVQSMRVSTFMINIDGTPTKSCVKIDNKYVNYFVKMNDSWYAVMRLSMWTLNAGVFATWTNTVFYKINGNIVNFDNSTNALTLDKSSYVKNSEFTLGIFRSKDSSILVLNPETYRPITKADGNEFDILTRFRNEQLISYQAKEDAIYDTLDSGGDLAGALF